MPTPTPTPSAPPTRPPAWVIPLHILAVALLQSTAMASQALIPILARKHFGAGDWQTVLLTATPTIFFSLSIFWNDYFGRRPFGRYLLTYWAVACLPFALMALAHGYTGILIPHLIACIGGAGYYPAAGGLLKSLYPDRLRGRIYSMVWGSSMVFGAGGGLLVGKWMERDPESFRIFLPAAAGLQLLGAGVFILLAHSTGHAASRVLVEREETDGRVTLGERWRRLVAPVAHMGEILRSDATFARYEAAYMTYGVGWMICYALVPILVTTRLGLNYGEIAQSTQAAYWLAMTAAIVPAGMLMDRVGAARSTGLSFALLTFYPLGLMLVADHWQLMFVSVFYGLVHSGANVGWMLGPVSMAPTPEKVPQYVAIHATLVGIRGKLFQFLGVGLYSLTHDFRLPLGIASAALAWSAVQMFQLHARIRAASPAAGGGGLKRAA